MFGEGRGSHAIKVVGSSGVMREVNEEAEETCMRDLMCPNRQQEHEAVGEKRSGNSALISSSGQRFGA